MTKSIFPIIQPKAFGKLLNKIADNPQNPFAHYKGKNYIKFNTIEIYRKDRQIVVEMKWYGESIQILNTEVSPDFRIGERIILNGIYGINSINIS